MGCAHTTRLGNAFMFLSFDVIRRYDTGKQHLNFIDREETTRTVEEP
jgi:hypothetical protein